MTMFRCMSHDRNAQTCHDTFAGLIIRIILILILIIITSSTSITIYFINIIILILIILIVMVIIIIIVVLLIIMILLVIVVVIVFAMVIIITSIIVIVTMLILTCSAALAGYVPSKQKQPSVCCRGGGLAACLSACQRGPVPKLARHRSPAAFILKSTMILIVTTSVTAAA